MVQNNGSALAVLDDELPGSVAASCCVLERGESVGSLMGWHSVTPSGIVGCGVETWFWETRASRWLIPVWLCRVAIIWVPDLVRDLLAIGGVSVEASPLLGVKNSS